MQPHGRGGRAVDSSSPKGHYINPDHLIYESASSRIVGVSNLTGLALDTLFVCRVACFCFFLFQLLVYSLP